MANCKKCGAALPSGAIVCEYCGSAAEIPEALKTYPAAGAKSAQEWEKGGAPVSRDSAASAPGFKKVSMGLMVVFSIITCGLYLSIWFFMRRKQFTELAPKAAGKAGAVFGSLLVIHIIYTFALLGAHGSPDTEMMTGVWTLCYVMWGVMIYSAIIARGALAEFSAARGVNFAGSRLWTVVFCALYLQSQINGMINARILGETS